jgi:hypothetical protein
MTIPISGGDAAGNANEGAADRLSAPWRVLAVILIAVSVFFRIWHLANIPGVNGDEAWYGVNCQKLLHHQAVTWVTPNGNSPNPFYYAPLFVLQALLPPSIELLRLTAVVYGILALWVNWALCRRVFGLQTAIATTLLLAVLPEDIAQSRLGWDPSQSLPVDAIVFYLALMMLKAERRPGGYLIACVIALSAAIVIHPSNIFMALFVVVAIAMRWRAAARDWLDPRVPGMKWLVGYLGLLSAVAGVLAWKWDWISAGLQSTLQTNSAQVFPLFYLRLFDGITVFRYVAGSLQPDQATLPLIWTITIATGVVFAPVVWAAMRSLIPSWSIAGEDRLVFVGWLTVFAAFLVIGGAGSLSPGNERYGIVLILPGVVALVRSYEQVAARSAVVLKAAAGGLGAICILLLAGFYICYFRYIMATGGRSFDTFRTAAVEPKLQAWRLIQSQSVGASGISIVVTSTWWNYQPLSYFASNDRDTWVLETAQTKNPTQAAQIDSVAHAGHLWFVEFADSPKIADIKQQLDAGRSPYHEQIIDDYAGNAVLDILHVTGGAPPAIM